MKEAPAQSAPAVPTESAASAMFLRVIIDLVAKFGAIMPVFD
jgi:hypothetical protein